MKLLILLVSIGFVVSDPTKEELIKRATELEARLEVEYSKIFLNDPNDARILESEIRELKLLVGELAKNPTNHQIESVLENRLAAAERRAEETLKRIDSRNGTTIIDSSTLSTINTTQTTILSVMTTTPLNMTTPEIISNSCETELINKLSQNVKKLNEKIDVLSQQHKEDEAIKLSDQVRQILLWEKQIKDLFIQINKIVEQVDILGV